MDTRDVLQRVRWEIESFRYVVPEPDVHIIGRPWDEEKVASELSKLRDRLVFPHRREFSDRDTPGEQKYAEYWVVAIDGFDVIFYDECADEFGLAVGDSDAPPETISIRGDLPSVFMAR